MKTFCDELRPFFSFANSEGMSDTATFMLREAGHRIDLTYSLNDRVNHLQITTSFSDARILHPALPNLGRPVFNPGYQQALAHEVSQREGFSSSSALYVRDKQGVATTIEESELAHSADELGAALGSGLKACVTKKMKPDYQDCELLVWHAAYEDYYRPNYNSIVQQVWQEAFNGYFNAVHFMFGDRRVSVDSCGTPIHQY